MLVVFGGLLAIGAFLGSHDALKRAGSLVTLLFSALSSFVDGVTTVDFFAFFIFVAGIGVSLMRGSGEDKIGAAAVTAAPKVRPPGSSRPGRSW